MTEQELKKLGENLDRDLAASTMSEAQKQAVKDRQVLRAKELAEVRAIRGLEEGTGKKRQKIMLPNGIVVNADAFDD
jgi:hypothetical protein